MPVGLLGGLREVSRGGLREGLGGGTLVDASAAGPLSSVARDATSLIYCPATAAQWTTLMSVAGLATGNPSFVWLCDEASSNLVDEIAGLTLAPNASPSYQQAVTGWTRTAVTTTDGTANQRFSSTDATLPDISATSAMLVTYVGFGSAPAAVRGVQSMGTTMADARHNTVAPRLVSGANTGNGAATLGTQVRPWVNRVVVGATNVLFTDQEKVAPSIGALTGKQIRIGSTGAVCASAQYLYAALFVGAAAELSDAQVKTLLQTLGWTIPWS